MRVTERYRVKSIDTFQTKEWCLKKHYAKRMPPISYAFGLFEQDVLIGICTFGVPLSPPLRQMFEPYPLLELNRLVINEGYQKNALSYFVGSCLKQLPPPTVVVSFADTSMKHHGYIYQATNWIYTGLSFAVSDYVIIGEEAKHNMSIIDKERNNPNRFKDLKEKFGDKLYKKKRDQKHRYFQFLGNKYQKQEMKDLLKFALMAYPKGLNERYDAGYNPTVQSSLF